MAIKTWAYDLNIKCWLSKKEKQISHQQKLLAIQFNDKYLLYPRIRFNIIIRIKWG